MELDLDKIANQVPALAVFALVVWGLVKLFLNHLKDINQSIVISLKDLGSFIRDNTKAINKLTVSLSKGSDSNRK